MTERFTIEVDIKAKDSTGPPLKSAKSGFEEAFGEIATGALRRAGEGLAGLAAQIPGMIVDMGKLGVEVQTNQRRFEQFAGGTARAEMFLESFNEGTGNTVDRMAAMSSSARLLQMGLVTTGDEMSQISSIATKLGDQTMGAGDRIADFAALLANQSIPRLDNFGISSGRVRQRIDELLASGQALNREEAFKLAVMEEGAKSLDTLGNVSDLTSVKMEVLAASLQTAKQGFAEIIAEDIAGLAGDIEKTGEAVRDLPTRFRDWREAIQGTTFAHRANTEEIQAAQEATRKQREETENASAATRAMEIDLVTGTESHRQYADAMDVSNAGLDQLAISSANYNQEIQLQAALAALAGTATQSSAESFDQYQAAINGAAAATDTANFALMKNAEITDAAALSTAGLAASLKDATDAQIAQAAISELGRALQEGEITVDAYATAVEETQLAFGLADEQSIFLTNSLAGLTEALASGAISADGYDEALAEVITQSETAGIEVGVFGDALDGLPKTINIDIVTRFKTEGAPPSQVARGAQENIPEFQGGTAFAGGGLSMVGERGPELQFVPRGASVFPADQSRHINNNFNLNVNSPASSMGVQNEFAMMQSLAA